MWLFPCASVDHTAHRQHRHNLFLHGVSTVSMGKHAPAAAANARTPTRAARGSERARTYASQIDSVDSICYDTVMNR
jgi:hypothetical protein